MPKKVLGGIAVVVLVAACACIFLSSGSSSTYYYAQIDNSKLEQVESRGGVIDFGGGLPYAYTLCSYDENGNEKDIRFGASRELKEGAFVRLTVVPIRGTVAWEELQYGALPTAVQEKYAPPQ